MRSWSVEVWLLNEAGEEVPATVFDKVMYELHPTFTKPKQSTHYLFLLSTTFWGASWTSGTGPAWQERTMDCYSQG